MKNSGDWVSLIGYVLVGLAAALTAWLLIDILPPIRSLAPGGWLKIS